MDSVIKGLMLIGSAVVPVIAFQSDTYFILLAWLFFALLALFNPAASRMVLVAGDLLSSQDDKEAHSEAGQIDSLCGYYDDDYFC